MLHVLLKLLFSNCVLVSIVKHVLKSPWDICLCSRSKDEDFCTCLKTCDFWNYVYIDKSLLSESLFVPVNHCDTNCKSLQNRKQLKKKFT